MSHASPETRPPAGAPPTPHLGPLRKSVYALGDVTVNTALSSLGLIYTSYFLTQVADLRPALAGLVPLVGRFVDAVTDPLMGRISDHTRWRAGRRRPWFLIGALPFGLLFALLWSDPPLATQGARFAYYAGIYCLLSVAITVVSVPYLAIQPEMALGYDDRTSLNAYRTAGSLVGVMLAVSVRSVAESLGDGPRGFALAGWLFGALVAIPWVAVFFATFERRSFRARPAEAGVVEGLRTAFSHATFTRLTAIYIMGRISMDLASALIILYVDFWIGRPEDYLPTMVTFVGFVLLALPFWRKMAEGREKSRIFVLGSVWWSLSSLFLFAIQPDWPRALLFLFVAFVGLGYAVVDVMPWSMLGEVIDEDDLMTGERREGLYNGVFTFIRKLGGALGVWLVLSILDVAGLTKGEVQSETVRQTIRVLTALGPAVFLAVGVWLCLDYPLTRRRHDEIVRALVERDAAEQPPERR